MPASASSTVRAVCCRSSVVVRPSRSASWASDDSTEDGCSAAIHHTMSYSFMCRYTYSMTSCVLPTPPMPCRVCGSTDAFDVVRRASPRRSRSAMRPLKFRLRIGTAPQIRPDSSERRGLGGGASSSDPARCDGADSRPPATPRSLVARRWASASWSTPRPPATASTQRRSCSAFGPLTMWASRSANVSSWGIPSSGVGRLSSIRMALGRSRHTCSVRSSAASTSTSSPTASAICPTEIPASSRRSASRSEADSSDAPMTSSASSTTRVLASPGSRSCRSRANVRSPPEQARQALMREVRSCRLSANRAASSDRRRCLVSLST